MSNATNDHGADFLNKWKGTPKKLDLSELTMILDASESVLKTKFTPGDITPQMIVDFSRSVALQLYQY
jgi:hypothetical protein